MDNEQQGLLSGTRMAAPAALACVRCHRLEHQPGMGAMTNCGQSACVRMSGMWRHWLESGGLQRKPRAVHHITMPSKGVMAEVPIHRKGAGTVSATSVTASTTRVMWADIHDETFYKCITLLCVRGMFVHTCLHAPIRQWTSLVSNEMNRC